MYREVGAVFRTPGAIAHYCLTASICRVGEEIARPGATRHNSSLSNLQPPCQAVCWVCPVRSEVGQSAIPIAVRGRLGTVASCIEWFAWTVGVPAGSQGACQKYAHHVATVCQCATHFCPHPRIPTASDADPPLVDGSINRPLYLANARTCQLPRRRAGAQASVSCNGCAGL